MCSWHGTAQWGWGCQACPGPHGVTPFCDLLLLPLFLLLIIYSRYFSKTNSQFFNDYYPPQHLCMHTCNSQLQYMQDTYKFQSNICTILSMLLAFFFTILLCPPPSSFFHCTIFLMFYFCKSCAPHAI